MKITQQIFEIAAKISGNYSIKIAILVKISKQYCLWSNFYGGANKACSMPRLMNQLTSVVTSMRVGHFRSSIPALFATAFLNPL
jgi:hypothetical protein